MTHMHTGERLVEESYQASLEDYVIYLMHLAAYRFAESYTMGKRVLDYGCGTGYGAALLAHTAASVCAVDVAKDAIAFAQAKYSAPNLTFTSIAVDGPVPAQNASFDTVLSFQVIEHIHVPDLYLREARRVLAPDGTLLVVTPDRANRLLPGQRPWNRWHVREFNGRSLEELLRRHFSRVEMQRMSGRPELAQVELRRWRKTKWLTLPLTLPIWPDRVRVGFLNIVHAMRPKGEQHQAARTFPFDLSAIHIAPEAVPSLNLVAAATAGLAQ
jgi:SAM-dependent methyltransferase